MSKLENVSDTVTSFRGGGKRDKWKRGRGQVHERPKLSDMIFERSLTYTLAAVHTKLGEQLGHDSIRILFTKWEIIIMKCVAFM